MIEKTRINKFIHRLHCYPTMFDVNKYNESDVYVEDEFVLGKYEAAVDVVVVVAAVVADYIDIAAPDNRDIVEAQVILLK